jgi:hypothetical protein
MAWRGLCASRTNEITSGHHLIYIRFAHLCEVVHSVCSRCLICKKCKVSHKKYGHLPSKEAEDEPWERLCVDLIGPYTIPQKGAEPL